MSTVSPAHAVVGSPARLTGRPRLLHPTRGYAVTRNPFAVWQVLPALTLAFAAMAIAMMHITDAGTARIATGAFAIVTTGLLLVPAVALKGSLNLTHDGITFERGSQHLTAAWDQVDGVVYRRGPGLCLLLHGAQQTAPGMRLPGGFGSTSERTEIPLRMFGDRQFSILYDVRDRLPAAAWEPALTQASTRPGWRILLAYAGVVAICGLAMFAVMFAITH